MRQPSSGCNSIIVPISCQRWGGGKAASVAHHIGAARVVAGLMGSLWPPVNVSSARLCRPKNFWSGTDGIMVVGETTPRNQPPNPPRLATSSASPKPAESEGLHLEHRRGWLPWNSKSRSRNRQITRDRQPNPNWSRTRSCLLTWSLMLMSLLWLKSSIGIRTPRRPGGHGNSICLMALHNTTSRIRSPHDDTGSSAHPVGVTVVRTRATFHHCCRATSRCPVWGCSPIGYWIGPGIGSQLQIVQSYAPGMSECDKYDSQLSRVCSIRPAKLDRRA